MKPCTPILALIAIFLARPCLGAELSGEWVSAPAFAPNIKVLIHPNSLTSTEASSISVQEHTLRETRVKDLMSQLERDGLCVDELYPHACFRLKRADLKSTQTWCKTANERVYAFIELGRERLSENQMQDLVFRILAGQR